MLVDSTEIGVPPNSTRSTEHCNKILTKRYPHSDHSEYKQIMGRIKSTAPDKEPEEHKCSKRGGVNLDVNMNPNNRLERGGGGHRRRRLSFEPIIFEGSGREKRHHRNENDYGH